MSVPHHASKVLIPAAALARHGDCPCPRAVAIDTSIASPAVGPA